MADLDFIQVGELAKGIRQETLPAVEALVGRSLQLFYENGAVTRVAFVGPHDLLWEVSKGPAAGSSGEETYLANRIREDIFFVDYVSTTRPATSVSLILDLASGDATSVRGTLPREAEVQKGLFALASEGSELTAVGVEFLRAAIDRPFALADHHHLPTTEMVGKRVKYVYGPTEVYEHIYLNEKLYTWQCLSGTEKGLADTDRCHAFKLADQLYLFVWREKVVPTLGVVVTDWREWTSTGKLLGYESDDFDKVVTAPIASTATLLNVTDHGKAG
jgi:hypothetical protein